MVRLARGAARGGRGKMGRGRGVGPPPPLMARNSVMPPPIPPPHMPPPRMRPLPPPGMRSPPFVPPMPPPLPPPPPHMRPPPPRLPPVPPVPPLRRNLPFPPRPPVPMFPPHGPIPRMPPPPPPLMRGRGRPPRGVELRHAAKMRKLGITPFKNRKGKKNKPVKDKNEEEFFCENCDKGFKTEDKLNQHCSEHVTCGIEGCTFVAHQKVIDKHILLQHKSGLYSKIANKDSPEDIAEWIKQRKRNYPTKKNVEQKNAQKVEMDRRGERIRSDRGCFAKTFTGKHEGKHGCDRNLQEKNFTDVKQKNSSIVKRNNRFNKIIQVLNTEIEQQYSWRGSLPHFPGTALFPEACEDDKITNNKDEAFSDSEWEDDSNITSSTVKKPLSSVLAALNSAYGSSPESSEDEEKEDKEDEITRNQKTCQESYVIRETTSDINNMKIEQFLDNNNRDSGPEEIPVLRKDVSESNGIVANCAESKICDDATENEIDDKRKRKRKRVRNRKCEEHEQVKKLNSVQPKQFIPRKRLTLLQKLLEPEIRHERNVILQCVRYVVENNFFGIGQ
ncbi:FMR1-interacting protein NUFIP1-like [Lycorma delicatula]|uniref:FMR1-interacting protein NUFIP1-like n=1 Tax=Lycorma delicatula TaxID=130591 RepID=UPI003F516EB7